MKKSNKSIIALLIVLTIGLVGLTVAYFANTTDVANEFKTNPYGTTVEETFNAPSNWLPGDITKKEITATNTGEVDEAVRISFEESWTPYNTSATLNGWIHQDGSKSSHTTESELANDERVAVINFDNDSDWDYEDGYYYYKYKIAPGETTSSLIKSVTFNAKTKLDDTCTTTEGNGTKTITCNSSGSDYDHATYTLTFTVETVQYDKYAQAWQLPQNTTIAIGGSKPQGVNFAQAIMSKSNAASITNYTDGVTTEAYTFNHEATEQTPALTDYRYIGASPNNYVEFNCDDNGENCEVWRAIGVFYVDDGEDNWEWRVKLVRGDILEERVFEPTGENNDWTIAPLMTYLNGDYYNGIATKGLTKSARDKIDVAKYNLGAVSYNSGYGTTEKIYGEERANTICGACNNHSDKLTWEGNVGLLYPSDMYMVYGNGVDNTCYINPNGCSDSAGKTNGWLYNTNKLNGSFKYTWLLSSHAGSSDSVLVVNLTAELVHLWSDATNFGDSGYGVRPVLYLSSSVKTTSGDESIDSPYKLSL